MAVFEYFHLLEVLAGLMLKTESSQSSYLHLKIPSKESALRVIQEVFESNTEPGGTESFIYRNAYVYFMYIDVG